MRLFLWTQIFRTNNYRAVNRFHSSVRFFSKPERTQFPNNLSYFRKAKFLYIQVEVFGL